MYLSLQEDTAGPPMADPAPLLGQPKSEAAEGADDDGMGDTDDDLVDEEPNWGHAPIIIVS